MLALRMRDGIRVGETTVWSAWTDNALTDDGRKSMLDTYFRDVMRPELYLAMLDMPDSPPVRNQRMQAPNWRESGVPGNDGYRRLPLQAGDWLDSELDADGVIMRARQKEFGPLHGDHLISHVALVTVPNGEGGEVILYVPGSFFAKRGLSQVVAAGQSYLVQFSDKQA